MRPPVSPDGCVASNDEERQLSPIHYDLEKLGRERPEVFASALAEIFFCFSLLASMLMAVRIFKVGGTIDSTELSLTLYLLGILHKWLQHHLAISL
jgi:hypothetical protein